MTQLILFSLVTSISITSGFGQIKAITDKGEQVVLHKDGTWEYLEVPDFDENSIRTNGKEYKTPEASNFLVKSSRVNAGVKIDSKKWSFEKKEGEAAEYFFQFKKGDLYGMLITEKFNIPLDNLVEIAILNGQKVAPDIKIIDKEFRMVNGQKVLHMQLSGTIQGIKFVYYGYYFSNENGTVQFVTYTSQNLLNDYRKECDDLLNGFTVME